MIEKIQIALMFVGLCVNLAWTIATLVGLNFQIDNPHCKEEVKMIQGNRNAVKIMAIFNLVVFGALFVLSNI
jgi:hypothetical protein